MREPLQDFGDSQYERPHCPWVCGLAEEGHACPAGPTAWGRCPALAHCHPRRVGDRWECNRAPLRGGPCATGPSPEGVCSCVDRCHPVRNLRSRRGRFVTACTLFTLGALLMVASSDWRATAMRPGPLAQNHAQILADRNGSQRCATCHEAAGGGLSTWLAATVWHPAGTATQSRLCLECHKSMLPADVAFVAHNVSPETLREMTAAHGEGSWRPAQMVLGSPTSSSGEIACSRCHREHQGTQVDLTAMTNAACQACHVERYDSFASDHPDFGVWPYERRTRIAFDHAAHQGKHFPKENATFDCSRCHLDDASQEVKLLASYEAACAQCHDESIATSIGTGVPVLALPMIDIDALAAAGVTFPGWPEQATGDFDGQVPTWMKLLLAADPKAAAAMRELGADFEYADVDPDNVEQVRAAAELVAASKRLLTQLATSGRQVTAERLTQALGVSVEELPTELLLAGLSVDTLQAAQESWFPTTTRNPMTDDGARIQKLSGQSTWNFSPVGEWRRNDSSFSIEYQPAGHADPVFTSWINLIVKQAGENDDELLKTLLTDISQSTAAGQCISCHSIEPTDSGLVVNWRALRSEDKPRDFTRFTHGPHLIQPQLRECTYCHQIDTSADTSVSYTAHDPRTFVSDFHPISKGQCAECHTPQAAGDSCQSCHHYHVEGHMASRKR